MAAGLGFKTFNTGDVLSAADTNGYLMQGVLVFADATARTAAITSPEEGQVSFLKDTNSTEFYDGSAWVAIGGGSSPLTTKGDLYTYSTTDARLAVGANGSTLVADSSEATGLKWVTAGTFTSYTPTLTNMTLGNGTVTARYAQVGELVTVFFNFLLGSTSAISTNPSFSLPVTAITNSILYNAYFQDAGTNTYLGGINLTTTTGSIYVPNASGTYNSFTSVTSTVPFTWTTNDFIRAFFTYEVA
jgi:hypothetical protein